MSYVDFPNKVASIRDRPVSQQKESRKTLLWVLHLLGETRVDPLEAFGFGLP